MWMMGWMSWVEGDEEKRRKQIDERQSHVLPRTISTSRAELHYTESILALHLLLYRSHTR
jgi:hypothetical protein